jgi:anti-sigma factor ChrR (cupin superfamily)
MTSSPDRLECDQKELVAAYVLGALPPGEVPSLEAHLSACSECREELRSLIPVIDSFSAWPTDVLRPSRSLWGHLAQRIAAESGDPPLPQADRHHWEPQWEEVAPGISCQLLATDTVNDRVSMLVRLGPGVDYPPHIHAGTEELHLLQGELWINDRKLYPGDYNRAELGTADQRVWSETGCTCVLITSTRDVIC